MIGTLLRFRNTAVYLRPRCHCPVQCIEMKRETRKEIVQGLRCDLPGPVDNREDETLLGGEGTAQFRGPVWWKTPAQNPEPWLRSRIQSLERLLRERCGPSGGTGQEGGWREAQPRPRAW